MSISVRVVGLLVVVATALGACGEGDGEAGPASVERRTIGDTTEVIVHLPTVEARSLLETQALGTLDGTDANYVFGRVGSLAVGSDGHLFVLDAQALEIRRFDPAGTWVRSYGRAGEGPGEFGFPNAITVRPDGGVFARDSRLARVQGFTPEPVQWPVVDPGYGTTAPLWSDDRLRLHVITRDPDAGTGRGLRVIVRVVDADGAVVRESSTPFEDVELATATAEWRSESGSGRASSPVPFTPQVHWAIDRSGSWVGGVSDTYRIQVWGPERQGVLRFGRTAEPVAVAADERVFHMDRVQRSLRNTDPDWDWNGIDVPRVKPPFSGVHTAGDGRIWVRTAQPGSTRPDPRAPETVPEALVWTEPTQFDVFSADGDYEMSVAAPEELSLSPPPVFLGDSIWAVSRDELGVERVKKWVVDGPGGGR